jgi:hypothetical protein
MNYIYVINTAGLILDFGGFLMVFFYGVPTIHSKTGPKFFSTGNSTQEEKDKQKYYHKLSKIGALLIILGFALQLYCSFIQIKR